MAEHEDNSLFREIDEELREEQFAKLWKQYGSYIIGVAIVIVAIVAGYQGWQTYDAGRKTESSAQLAAAFELADSGDSVNAQAALNTLGETGRAGHAMLARFRAAALLAEGGDMAGAADAYRALAEDGSLDALYQGLALVLEATTRLANGSGEDLDALDARLAAISGDDNPWRHSARELMALAAIVRGDTARARGLLDGLSEDTTVPDALRRRAADLRQTL